MSMLEQRIQQQFFEAADLFNDAAATLPRVVAQAVEAIVGCVTAGGKVLVAGSESGAALAPVRQYYEDLFIWNIARTATYASALASQFFFRCLGLD